MGKVDFCDLYTKSNIYKIISEDIKKGMTSHAYLFCAKDEMTAKYITHAVSKHLMCPNKASDNCSVCERIEHGNHVDVKVYPQNDKVILSDDLKDILKEAYIKPTTADQKIFVLNNFDQVGVLSQNKILKTLEEPPQGVVFLLGCVHPDAVLNTIKSRCKVCVVADFDTSDIEHFLQTNCKDGDIKDALISCMGSLGRAYKIANSPQFVDIKNLAHDIVYNLSSSQNALDFSKRILDIKAMDELCDEIVLVAGHIAKKLDSGEYPQFSYNLLYKIIRTALDYKRKFLASGNITILADRFVMKILEEKYLCKK